MAGLILHELYARTLTRLTGGRAERPNRPQLTERLAMSRRDEMTRQAVKAHVAMVSDRYLARDAACTRMAEHLRMLQRLDEAPVVTELFHHPDLGSSDLVVVTRDVPGLFALIAGTLAAQGINIMSAQIHTRADGVAIDTFQVNDPVGEVVTSATHWTRTLEALRRGAARRAARGRRCSRGGGRPAGRRGPLRRPRSCIDNRLSDDYTVIEVKCPDRLGLLYLDHADAVRPRAGHRERPHRDRDRSGARHVLRPRSQGGKVEDPAASAYAPRSSRRSCSPSEAGAAC